MKLLEYDFLIFFQRMFIAEVTLPFEVASKTLTESWLTHLNCF